MGKYRRWLDLPSYEESLLLVLHLANAMPTVVHNEQMAPMRPIMLFHKPRDGGAQHNLRLLALIIEGNHPGAVREPLSKESV